MISVSRFAFALAFLAIVYADPAQPAPGAYRVTYLLLSSYTVWAAFLVGVTWNDWLLDYRLMRPAHIVDLAVFAATALVTEGLTSPFFTFFVFLVLAALKRFGGRAAALTAAAAIILFTAAGAASVWLGISEPEWDRFFLRRYYLLLLSLLVIWFGANEAGWFGRGASRGDPDDLVDGPSPSIDRLLHFVSQRTSGGRAALLWTARQEPWVYLSTLRGGRFEEQRLGPDAYPLPENRGEGGHPFLFDRVRQCMLWADAQRRLRLGPLSHPIAEALAANIDVAQGLAIPVETDEYSGTFVVGDIAGLCLDDLRVGQQLAGEVEAAFNRATLIQISSAAAADRTRLSLARDVHDSVLQLLAAAGFRLEALRRTAATDPQVQSGLAELQEEFVREQDDLRAFIADLRGGPDMEDAAGEVRALADRLSNRWHVSCQVTLAPEPMPLPARLKSQVTQLIRETVANAVRHGAARRIEIDLERQHHRLQLSVRDDGIGIQAARARSGRSEDGRPWSLDERVRELGGTLSLESRGQGTAVSIVLRVDEAA